VFSYLPSEYQMLGLLSFSLGFIFLASVQIELPESSLIRRLFVKTWATLRKSPLKTLMIVGVFSRGFVFAVGLAAATFFKERPCRHCWNNGIPFINLFSRWDSGYYVNIALRGYSNLIVPRWEFFPGYPIVMGSLGRVLTLATGTPLVISMYWMGFVVSNLSFFGSMYYLYKLSAKVLGDNNLAFYSALSLAFYPAGVFLSAAYSDSLFLLLMLSSLYYWRMKKYPQCSLLGFFGALTRPVGVVLVIPYLVELIRDRSLRKNVSAYLPVAIVPFGFLSFLAYSQLMTGTPFATFEAGRLYWQIAPDLPRIIGSAYSTLVGNPIIVPYIAIAIGGMVTSILSPRSRTKTAIHAYALVLLATYLYAPLISFPRYSITLVPAYWGYARWSQRARSLVFAIFLVLLAIGVALFVNWYRFY